MSAKRVVVTGMGIVSPIGTGREDFYDKLFKGVSGIRPITLFDTTPYSVKSAGEITDFTPETFLGQKGLRTLDRSTKLVSSATKLALIDAGITVSEENSRDIGVSVGCTLGSIKSISDFDKEAIVDGPRYVNPAHFPNTVINSPASQVAIRFGIKGFNATLSTGYSAGLDAINYAADFVKLGRINIALAGGVEELCEQLFIAFYKTGCMARASEGGAGISCPFDARRNGLMLAEGSAILVLEEMDAALKRKAKIFAEIRGFGTSADKKQGLEIAMKQALKQSGLDPDDIGCVLAAANSSIEADRREARAIKDIFAKQAKSLYISAIKSMAGEQYSNSGSFQAAAAAAAIEKGMLPPQINYREKDPSCELNIITEPIALRIENIMVNACGKGGISSSMVISRFQR